MSLFAIQFNFSELRLSKITPYIASTLLVCWLATLLYVPAFLLVPAILFLGFRAAIWSAMSHSAFENYGRRTSRNRLLEMIPSAVRSNCPKAINLRNYILIAPYFWVIYFAFLVVAMSRIVL